MNPLVSIVIPTKRRKEKLLRLLSSIKKSTYQTFEVIVVNDDNESLNLLTKELRIINNGKSKGLAYSRSQGAKRSKGEFVLFIDDDNIVDDRMIGELVKSFNSEPLLTAVGPLTYYESNREKIWFIGSKLNMFTSKPTFKRSYDANELINSNLILTQNLHNCFMVRKDFGDSIGWFDETVVMNGTEFDMFQRMKKKYKNIKLATNIHAVCYHDVPEFQTDLLRSMGFDNKRESITFREIEDFT